jgi:hypothetical protein
MNFYETKAKLRITKTYFNNWTKPTMYTQGQSKYSEKLLNDKIHTWFIGNWQFIVSA